MIAWVGGVAAARAVWWVVWIADCLVQLATRAPSCDHGDALRDAVPERALQIAGDVGRGCSGCASGVVGAVDRWLSGQDSH